MFVLVPKAERGTLLFWMLQLRHNGFKESCRRGTVCIVMLLCLFIVLHMLGVQVTELRYCGSSLNSFVKKDTVSTVAANPSPRSFAAARETYDDTASSISERVVIGFPKAREQVIPCLGGGHSSRSKHERPLSS